MQRRPRLQLALLVVAGLTPRLLLAPYGMLPSDVNLFRAWALRLVDVPLAEFYASGADDPAGIVDHLPGDLWLLWGIARLYHLVSPEMAVERPAFLLLLKLVPILADVGAGLLLYAIARDLAGPRAGLLAAAGMLFNPAAIFVSAIWAQWDSVSACGMLLALSLLLRGNPAWALPPLTWVVLIKPQFALLLPLLLLAWWRWRVLFPGASLQRGRLLREVGMLLASVILSLGLLLAVCLPFDVGLPPLSTRWTVVERMQVAFDQAPVLSRNAFNLWGVIAPGDLGADDRQRQLSGQSYQHWGMLLLGVAVATALALFWRRPRPEMAVWCALATLLAAFVLPTRMHERYLLPAVVLAVLLAALERRQRRLAVALTLSCLANLVAVYQFVWERHLDPNGRPYELVVLTISVVNVLLLVMIYRAGPRLVCTTDRRGP